MQVLEQTSPTLSHAPPPFEIRKGTHERPSLHAFFSLHDCPTLPLKPSFAQRFLPRPQSGTQSASPSAPHSASVEQPLEQARATSVQSEPLPLESGKQLSPSVHSSSSLHVKPRVGLVAALLPAAPPPLPAVPSLPAVPFPPLLPPLPAAPPLPGGVVPVGVSGPLSHAAASTTTTRQVRRRARERIIAARSHAPRPANRGARQAKRQASKAPRSVSDDMSWRKLSRPSSSVT